MESLMNQFERLIIEATDVLAEMRRLTEAAGTEKQQRGDLADIVEDIKARYDDEDYLRNLVRDDAYTFFDNIADFFGELTEFAVEREIETGSPVLLNWLIEHTSQGGRFTSLRHTLLVHLSFDHPDLQKRFMLMTEWLKFYEEYGTPKELAKVEATLRMINADYD
jgi:hypothetical protein